MIDLHYLKLLAKQFPNVRKASTEIVNLRAILNLPKGTEYFLSDLHGEHEAFIHMVKSASGMIRSKMDDAFGKTLSEADRDQLASLIYDAPSELALAREREPCFDEWCRVSIYRLIEVCKAVSTKYTRSKVRKRMSKDSEYILDELLHADDEVNRAHYYSEIIRSLLECGVAEQFIIELTEAISRLAVDRLHIIGDIYDRGAHPDDIMDYLMTFHDVDFQWGNHDILWMGAATGNWPCVSNAVRINIRYNNFDMLEIGYGLNLRPLSMFANDVYHSDTCEFFQPNTSQKNKYDPVDPALAARMHKAISIIQFKVEGQRIKQHPEYEMSDRLLLDKIDLKAGTIKIGGKQYPMRDTNLPTLDPDDPYRLSEGEQEIMRALEASARKSKRLQQHTRFLFSHGAMYKKVNQKLLFHGCIPLTAKGELELCKIGGTPASGQAYLDQLDSIVREAYFAPKSTHDADIMWYLWCGSKSPLFGKNRMTTFERHFIADKSTYKEQYVPYYKLYNTRDICDKILRDFGMDPESSHILNGHVPVKVKDGESPVKGEGKLFVIDGGMSNAYQKTTGIAGYTFIYNSRFMALAEHKPYTPREKDNTQQFHTPDIKIVEHNKQRITVMDTDIGQSLEQQIEELTALVAAFRKGEIKERY